LYDSGGVNLGKKEHVSERINPMNQPLLLIFFLQTFIE